MQYQDNQPAYEQPVADYVRFYAENRPDYTAYIDGDNRCSWREFDARTNRVANGLISEFCHSGKRIAFLGVNSGDYLDIFFGAMKSKTVVVGVNWRLAPPELEYILDNAEVNIVFCDPQFAETLNKLAEKLPQLQKVIVTGTSFQQWRDQYDAHDPKLAHSPDDVVLQFYTSGTTGKPKGVPLSNKTMSAHRYMEDQYGEWFIRSDRDEVVINAMPNFHVAGVAWVQMGMFRGATVVQMAQPDPGLFLDYIEKYKATHLFAVAMLLGLMLQEQKKKPRDLSSLKIYHYGASSIAPSVLEEAIRVMSCGFSQYYGMTEANGCVTNLSPAEHRTDNPQRLKSCGKPLHSIELRIVDEQGNDLPANSVGEILVKSQGMMEGYWKNPEASASAIVDGWYHSGDGGRLDEDGFLYIADRIKDMIITGGENVYPTEVENALLAHPAVAEAAVIGVPDEKWGEAVKAIIVTAPDQTITGDELVVYLRDYLAGFKIPRQYQFVDTIPRTPTGKVQKFKLS